MTWNFDETVGREGTDCIKYDLREQTFGRKDVIPMWVADMDFKTPEFIVKKLHDRLRHEIFGYSFRPPEYFDSIISWMKKRHNWEIEKDWICFCPGIVPELNLCTLTYTRPGDSIIVQPPVYFPFFTAVKNHGRELVYNQLLEKNGHYEMDFDDLERRMDERTRLLLLCHPHNPVGRLWTKQELETLVEICARKNVMIVSDEIHSDLMLHGNIHIPLASLSEKAAEISLTCIAPSKTFNLAGLSTSALIIPNEGYRKTYEKMLDNLHVGMGNLFGIITLEAAYNEGEDWLRQLLAYLDENYKLLTDFFASRIPMVKVIPADATYLIWLDFRKLGLKNKELKEFIIDKAGLGLNDGPSFGPGGDGFQRINIALPRKSLLDALEKLEKAVNSM